MKYLLIGNRNQDFISLGDNVKYGPGYRISGNICTLDNDRAKKKQRVLDKLIEFFDKFLSITGK